MPLLTTKFRRIARFARMMGGIDAASPGSVKKHLTRTALTSLTDGTDVTPVSGTRYSCSVFVPLNQICTGIGYLIGTVGGTDSVVVELHDTNGKLLANSAVAGTVVGTTATFQEVPFTAPVEIVGPGWYYLSLMMNGTTARFRTIPTALGISQTALAKSATGTFGTVGDLTVPTTFTAGVGPIAYTY